VQSVTQSLQQGLGTFFSYIPQLIGALVILIIGYIIAKVLQAITTRVLQSLGFEGWMERGGVKQFFERSQTRQTPLSIIGKVVFWFVFIIAIVMATDALGIRQVSAVFSQLLAYIPNIIAAILILVLATLLANFVAGLVRGATGMNILGTIAQAAIIVYAAFAALTQLGIAVQLTAPTFLILLGAVALAAAIAFGWGARNVAQDIVERAYDRSGEVRERARQQQDDSRGSEGERPDARRLER
jgi:small-conductance mechanosensitive channel